VGQRNTPRAGRSHPALGFTKGFKQDVKVTADLVETTERLLERAALDALAIAGKAKEVVTGFGKVEAALERTASKDCCMRPRRARRRQQDQCRIAPAVRDKCGEMPVVTAFNSAQLDLALGGQM